MVNEKDGILNWRYLLIWGFEKVHPAFKFTAN